MIVFAMPALVGVSGAVALAGGVALWRGRRRVRAISSVKLWEGLLPTEAARGRRWVDPLWLLIFFAAVLAALALAGPRWQVGRDVGAIDAEFALRGVRASESDVTEAWVRAAGARDGRYTFLMNGAVLRELTREELRHGVAVPVTVASDRVTLGLRANGGAAASRDFVRPDAAVPFGLLSESAPGGAIDAKLMQVFRLQPGAREGDFTITPAVVLLNVPKLTADDPALQSAAMVVGQNQTPLPGIALGKMIDAPTGGWSVERAVADGLPGFVTFEHVHVMKLRDAMLSAEWHILATAGGHPWIVRRQTRDADGLPRTWVWLASDPSTHSDWPSVPSFVLFFADATTRALSAAMPSRIVEWRGEPVPATPGSSAASFDLRPVLGMVVIALLLAGAAWFVMRAQIR